MTNTAPLWEIGHPYYANESNFYQNGLAHQLDSWADFKAEWADMDNDLNLVVRFDWFTDDEDTPLEERCGDRLFVVWVLQRKGIYCTTTVAVKREEEPEIRAWLTTRWEKMRTIWEGVSDWEEQP